MMEIKYKVEVAPEIIPCVRTVWQGGGDGAEVHTVRQPRVAGHTENIRMTVIPYGMECCRMLFTMQAGWPVFFLNNVVPGDVRGPYQEEV